MKSREFRYIKSKKFKKELKQFKRLMYRALSMTPTMDGKERDMKHYEGMLK